MKKSTRKTATQQLLKLGYLPSHIPTLKKKIKMATDENPKNLSYSLNKTKHPRLQWKHW